MKTSKLGLGRELNGRIPGRGSRGPSVRWRVWGREAARAGSGGAPDAALWSEGDAGRGFVRANS